MSLDGGDFDAGLRIHGGAYEAADDYIFMACAGGTHVDSLAHFWYDGQLYNGHSRSQIRSTGAMRLGIENLPYLVGRGVLLDVPARLGQEHLDGSHVVSPEDLEGCAEAAGVAVGPGDIVLIRTGWARVFYSDLPRYRASAPGIGLDAARWLASRDVTAVGSDNTAVETLTGPAVFEGGSMGPVSHRVLIRQCGMYVMELMDLEELSEARATEFLFVMAPLRIVGGVNSPVNPLAIL
jgi:kynurenine formamidase